MHNLIGHLIPRGNISWQIFERAPFEEEEGLSVSFRLACRMPRRSALQLVRAALDKDRITWLTVEGQAWLLDLDELKTAFPDLFGKLSWFKGRLPIEPEIEDEEREAFGEKRTETSVRFIAGKEWITLSLPKKIFLSHKGADKPRVREFSATLTAIGLEPWLDEDAMPAGEKLERGIRQGFSDSCAAVFFITPSFVDEGYLETEIDYALQEKRAKGDRFSIVTLLFSDESGRQPPVPVLLQPYVWKTPASDLEALREILRSLPVHLVATWRPGGS